MTTPTTETAANLWTRARNALPRGRTLPPEAWERRHRAMLWLLWAHVVGLPVFSLTHGFDAAASFGPVVPIALAGVAGMLHAPGRRARSCAVSLGLLTASAVLVHAWDGRIEAHFHYFVMIAVLALYEDWLPFGLSVAYVVAEHGIVGVLDPHSVYSHPGNPWEWAAIHAVFVLGAAAAAVVTWRLNEDMRARMLEAHAHARATAERFRHAFESGVTGMALVAPDGHFRSVNRAFCEITGYDEAELLERTFLSITHSADAAATEGHHRALLAGSTASYEAEKRYVHRDGHDVWVQMGVSAVRDDAGRIDYFVTQVHDITARRRFEDELAHRALHDPLTGLPNRALLLDRLRHALVRLRRHPGELAVLFVDVDSFKLVNDGLGYELGDEVLLEVGRRLCDAARAEDTVARFGGDEFTLLCEAADEREARAIAKRILDHFKRPFVLRGSDYHLTASVGIRVGDASAGDPDELLRDADIALHSAKDHGRARYELFDPDARMAGINVLATEQALRLALSRNELRLHYQPEVDLAGERIIGLEALVRWEHPERGLVPPGEFIPVAEETGVIVPMGEWVLREACSQLARWRDERVVDDGVAVSVNVSARQLQLPELPGTVAAALAAASLPPSALILEVTESAMIHDADLVLRNLEAIKAHGVSMALDDFGVGFSSLSQIRNLPPVDVIKIDRSFTGGLGDNESDTAVVTAVLGLAHSLGLTAVAEGVETAEQLAQLRTLGCDIGQGFFFSRPLPPTEIEPLLAAGVPVRAGETA